MMARNSLRPATAAVSASDMMEHEPAMSAFGKGEHSAFRCPSCDNDADLLDRKTQGVAGGFLGLQFWNWWPVTEAFQTEMSRLTGSEIVLIKGLL
jgi:hypothetical protein